MKTFMQNNLSRLKKNNLVFGIRVLSLVVWLILVYTWAISILRLKNNLCAVFYRNQRHAYRWLPARNQLWLYFSDHFSLVGTLAGTDYSYDIELPIDRASAIVFGVPAGLGWGANMASVARLGVIGLREARQYTPTQRKI
jgi:hypothetical protein